MIFLENEFCLSDINPGETAYINRINTTGTMRRRLKDIGIIKNTKIECVGKSPLGDPKAYLIRGAVIALRSEDCKEITVIRCGV